VIILIEGYCQYCAEASAMFCKNDNCDGNRKYVCKSCATDLECRCRDCDQRFIDIAELED
jgi:hypothetical protein